MVKLEIVVQTEEMQAATIIAVLALEGPMDMGQVGVPTEVTLVDFIVMAVVTIITMVN